MQSFFSIDSRWLLGYPKAALEDADRALKHAREIGEAATLMYALTATLLTLLHCGNYATATTQFAELVALTDEKGALFWKNDRNDIARRLLALTGKASDAIHIDHRIAVNGLNLWLPVSLSYLAKAYAELGQINDARRCIDDAMTAIETTKEGCGRPRYIASPVKSH